MITQRTTTKTDVSMGKRIRAQRVTMKISQADLGKKLGVSFQQIQKYEKGINRVSAVRLQEIAEALDVTTDFLMNVKDGEQGETNKEMDELLQFLSTSQGVQLARAFMNIPTGGPRTALIVVAETMSL